MTYLNTYIRPAAAMWMHHTWGPKFRSDTKGYDHGPLPIKSLATTRNPKLVRGESFMKGQGKAFVKWFWKSCFGKHSFKSLVSQLLQGGRSQPLDFKIRSTQR
jgi:hypothetical protein